MMNMLPKFSSEWLFATLAWLFVVAVIGGDWVRNRINRRNSFKNCKNTFEKRATQIRKLATFFGGVKPPVNTKELWSLFLKQDFAGLVGVIKSHFHLDLRMRVGFVNSGGDPNSPAWIRRPTPIPPYGTAAFRSVMATLYIRKDFLCQMPFETVVFCIAHEMAHLALDATGHPLREDEEVVDLVAMLSGFAELYVKGKNYQKVRSSGTTMYTFGYLPADDVDRAAALMKKMRRESIGKRQKAVHR